MAQTDSSSNDGTDSLAEREAVLEPDAVTEPPASTKIHPKKLFSAALGLVALVGLVWLLVSLFGGHDSNQKAAMIQAGGALLGLGLLNLEVRKGIPAGIAIFVGSLLLILGLKSKHIAPPEPAGSPSPGSSNVVIEPSPTLTPGHKVIQLPTSEGTVAFSSWVNPRGVVQFASADGPKLPNKRTYQAVDFGVFPGQGNLHHAFFFALSDGELFVWHRVLPKDDSWTPDSFFNNAISNGESPITSISVTSGASGTVEIAIPEAIHFWDWMASPGGRDDVPKKNYPSETHWKHSSETNLVNLKQTSTAIEAKWVEHEIDQIETERVYRIQLLSHDRKEALTWSPKSPRLRMSRVDSNSNQIWKKTRWKGGICLLECDGFSAALRADGNELRLHRLPLRSDKAARDAFVQNLPVGSPLLWSFTIDGNSFFIHSSENPRLQISR